MNFIRPEYIFRPSQIARRIAYSLGVTTQRTCAKAPWGLPIHFDPDELHGRAMLTLGLSDLRTNEIISRILRPGDIAVDIGANIGIMTSLMARRAGLDGAVYAFEPHPDTRRRLEKNVASWAETSVPVAPVTVVPSAVSDRAGFAKLVEPRQFSHNSGVAKLRTTPCEEERAATQTDVPTVNFDEWAEAFRTIRLIKIDVEGHEDAVLSGMQTSLATQKIEAIIFEELRRLPSPATETLKNYGYSYYMIDRNFWRPQLLNVDDTPDTLQGESTNVLALREPPKRSEILRAGWSCLK